MVAADGDTRASSAADAESIHADTAARGELSLLDPHGPVLLTSPVRGGLDSV